MIRFKPDSIKELNEKAAAASAKDQTIQRQSETIELLKGCIMELAEAIYGEEATV